MGAGARTSLESICFHRGRAGKAGQEAGGAAGQAEESSRLLDFSFLSRLPWAPSLYRTDLGGWS